MARAGLVAAILALVATQAAASGSDALLRKGERVYLRCQTCHALGYDRAGPHHCGLFGRRAGSVPGFDYSDAMKRSDIVWTAATLDRFLANPAKTVPGTWMEYAGMADPADRAAVIAYLQQASRCAPAH